MPYANPETARAYWKVRAGKRNRDGKCSSCTNDRRPGKSRCQPCADRYDLRASRKGGK